MANQKIKKNKILFVANTLLHHQSFNLFLARQCHVNKFEVVFVANLKEKNFTPIPKYIKQVNWNVSRGSTMLSKEWRAYLALKHIISKENPGVIHNFTVKANIYGSIAGKYNSHAKIINTINGLGQTFIDRRVKTFLVRTITKILWYWSINLSNVVYFLNHDDEKLFKRFIRHPKTIITPGHGIDLSDFSASKINNSKVKGLLNMLKPKRNELVITTMGRLIAQKGMIEFWQAAKLLKQQYDNLVFVIVGLKDNQNPSMISNSVIKEIEKDGIKILWNRDDVKEILSISDIFVLPSYREGLPQSIIEAQTMGLPIVTTNVPGCRERVKSGYNGLIVPKEDYLALAKANKKLIDSPGKRQLFAARNLMISKKIYDQGKIVKLIIKEYRIYPK